MIDQFTRDRIIDSAQILDVVSEYVSLRKRGVNHVGLCPFHADRNPSFYVSPSKNICKCFACGEGGTPLHFLMKIEQISYNEALRSLAKRYGIAIQERELTDDEKQLHSKRESLYIINQYAEEYFVKSLHDSAEGQRIALPYFKERGIRPETIEKFRLGYSLEERSEFTDQAIKMGYNADLLVESGLSLKYDDGKMVDRFRARVIFPVHTLSGKVVAFGGRIMGQRDKAAKYVNSPESVIYSKSRELYGLFEAKKEIAKQDKCYLVEGYTDVLSMHQAGVENVVSSSGTALTVQQVQLIRRFSSNITLLYDGDLAGIKAALRGINILLEEGMQVKVVLLPDGEDPDSFARGHSATEFEAYISENETDFIRFKTQLLLDDLERDPMKRAQLINDILQSIALIPDNIARRVYVQECSQALNMDEQLLVNEVKKIRSRGLAHQETRRLKEEQIAQRQAALQDKKAENASAEKQVDTEVANPQVEPIQSKEEPVQTSENRGRKNEFDPPASYEIELLRLIISYGERELLINPVDKKNDIDESQLVRVSLSRYIADDLKRDEIDLLSPLFEFILNETLQQLEDPKFKAASYFSNLPHAELSKLATDLLTERYTLSKIHRTKRQDDTAELNRLPEPEREKRKKELELQRTLKEDAELLKRVDRELLVLKNAFVMDQLKMLQKELSDLPIDADPFIIGELMEEIKELNLIKMEIASKMGERILIP